jgi:hypothetical protein
MLKCLSFQLLLSCPRPLMTSDRCLANNEPSEQETLMRAASPYGTIVYRVYITKRAQWALVRTLYRIFRIPVPQECSLF